MDYAKLIRLLFVTMLVVAYLHGERPAPTRVPGETYAEDVVPVVEEVPEELPEHVAINPAWFEYTTLAELLRNEKR